MALTKRSATQNFVAGVPVAARAVGQALTTPQVVVGGNVVAVVSGIGIVMAASPAGPFDVSNWPLEDVGLATMLAAPVVTGVVIACRAITRLGRSAVEDAARTGHNLAE